MKPCLPTRRLFSPAIVRLIYSTLFASLSFCTANTFAADSLVVRIGVATQGSGDPPTYGGSPNATARIQRRYEDALKAQGIQVKWFFFKGAGPAVNEALANKQIDFADQGDLPAVLGRANGIKSHIIVANGVRTGIYLAVPPGSDIKTVKDLKGKNVALFRGTNAQLVADNVLKANGLSERDLHVINLDTSAAQAALVAKGVDAAFLDYTLFTLQRQGLAKIIYSSREAGPQYTRQSHLLVLPEFEQAHPDVVQAVVTAFVQAAQWTSDERNRAALFALWANSGTPVSSWEDEFKGQQLKERASPLIDPFYISRYQKVADEALALHLIRTPVKVDGWFETKYLDHALQTLQLQKEWPRYDTNGKVIPG
ncbi:ABC transporter substrate-binding protein [Robbsia andropogonis]|uniref:ABC transporter substrate-binding protein n=1 Tax=Robbsia andropogonis TaxID=28092 RepID=UPI000463509C|nr:ABC transporter substrate-binding protein [Robbsia andropogonis]MCP1120709.1 ABC transporter substrate-binding protein [Robbsia andropogonis]MCP1130443.1 ABC transporter substrate-binding protein [Robbsia andropogonis]